MKIVVIVGKKRSGKDASVSYIQKKKFTVSYQLAGPIKDALAHGYSNFVKDQDEIYSKSYSELDRRDWFGNGIDREKSLPLNNFDAYLIIQEAIEYLSSEYLKIKITPILVQQMKAFVINNKEAWSIRRFMQALGTDIIVNLVDRMYWMKLFTMYYLDVFDNDSIIAISDIRQTHEIELFRALGATVIHVERPELESADTHITEAGLNILENELRIINDGTIEDLYTKLDTLIEKL